VRGACGRGSAGRVCAARPGQCRRAGGARGRAPPAPRPGAAPPPPKPEPATGPVVFDQRFDRWYLTTGPECSNPPRHAPRRHDLTTASPLKFDQPLDHSGPGGRARPPSPRGAPRRRRAPGPPAGSRRTRPRCGPGAAAAAAAAWHCRAPVSAGRGGAARQWSAQGKNRHTQAGRTRIRSRIG
jgi:hypothetical protein